MLLLLSWPLLDTQNSNAKSRDAASVAPTGTTIVNNIGKTPNPLNLLPRMKPYSQFIPTQFDVRGLGLPDQQDWLVCDISTNRDADALTRSNFKCFLKALGGESDTVEVHSFNHWGPGWFEIILINPSDVKAVKLAEEMEASLSDYPVLDESDYSEEEHNEANEVWAKCYDAQERVAYIRKHRSQFEFHDFRDLMSCVRGNYFAGYASELLH